MQMLLFSSGLLTSALQLELEKKKHQIRDVAKKKRENVGILKKQGGGGLPEPHFHIFTVFNMGDLPKINGKIGKKFPNRGEGGVPDLGKIPTFSRFFPADVSNAQHTFHFRFMCVLSGSLITRESNT